jgi:poly(A)-specific ribonuclease
VEFLIRNGFDFDRPYTHGVPYLSRKDEQDIKAAWLSRDLDKAALNDMPIKEDDAILIEHLHASVKKWEEEPAVSRESYLNIPNTFESGVPYMATPKTLNRYQIRLIHQIVRNDYPKLKTAGKGHFVQITALDDSRERSERLQQARYRDREISRAIEFRWLIEAICGGDIAKIPSEYFTNTLSSEVMPADDQGVALKMFIDNLQQKLNTRRRVLVGHNCFMDLVYLYSCFIGQLPDRVDDFLGLIREMLPAIIDTKFIASFGKGWQSTSLQDVELDLPPDGPGVPVIEVPVEYDRYTGGQRLHEAGYDSLLTANIAIRLSAKLEKEARFPAYQEPDATNPASTTDDDGSEDYATAPQSNADSEVGDLAMTLMNILSTPVTAIGNFFRSDLASTGHQSTDNPRADKSDDLEDLMVFNDKEGGKAEQEKITSELERLLQKASRMPDNVGTPYPRSLDSAIDKIAGEAEILEKVKKGELIPRWEGGRGFWQYFGNKLQVNSAEEGVCYL